MHKLVIIGATEFSKLAYEYFTRDSNYTVVGYSVDAEYITEASFGGLPVVPFEELATVFPPSDHSCHVAIGDNWLRERFISRTRQLGYQLASYVSSHAFVWPDVPVGPNAMIMEMNVVQPGAVIGEGVVLSSGNHVGHHSKIGDLCFLASHVVVAGLSKVGRRTFAGVNAAVAEKIDIAPDTYIAMSASVNKNVEQPGQILLGNPAVAASVSTYSYFGVSP